jgi:hypothetical protein
LKRSDIANAISRTDYYDFLIDIVEESCQNKLHLCANYQIIPSNTEADENKKIIHFNQGLYLDMNNPIPMNFGPENTDYNIGASAAINENRNINNFHLINKSMGFIPSVTYPYNIPVEVNGGGNLNFNKYNMLHGFPHNSNMNFSGEPSHNKNFNCNKVQTPLENTVTTYTNINNDKKNSDNKNNSKKEK